jgi:propanol-preferring alcohol dehydrogenase
MKAMVLKEVSPIEKKPLKMMDIPIPKLSKKQLLVKISICGVCHTELDEIEGRLPVRLPRVLGHEIVGSVKSLGSEATKFTEGERVGITWLNQTCGKCHFCIAGQENLCEDAQWTGKDVNGGYAQYTVISEDFTYPIPKNYNDAEAAPLLCAGVIRYRALRLTGLKNGQILGLYGFGASAHLVIQIVRYKYPDSKIFVFTRSQAHRDLANELGAHWTGQAEDNPPEKVNRAIDFTPVGQTVREALRVLEKGGRLVINAIRKVNHIPELDYTTYLWYEKGIQSVANVTKMDAEQFLPLSAEIPIVPDIHEFKLEEANKALLYLKQGKIQGAGILRIPA